MYCTSARLFKKKMAPYNIVWRSLNTVQHPSLLEPPGLCRNDNKRVDHPSVSGLLKIERYTRHATHVKLAAFL